MNELDQKIKDEIIKQIEFIFEPIGGKFVSFEKSREMYVAIREAYSTESVLQEKNKIVIYPIIVNTNLGELRMSVESRDLNNIKSAIGIGFSHSNLCSEGKISNKVFGEVQKRIYLDK